MQHACVYFFSGFSAFHFAPNPLYKTVYLAEGRNARSIHLRISRWYAAYAIEKKGNLMMRLQERDWRVAWMTDEERLAMKRFMASVRRLFKARNVQESPLLTLRVVDVGVHYLLARRLETALSPRVDDEGAAVLEISGALADQIGKTRERLRKAIRELEDACARLGAPVDVGIADEVAPMARATRDLLHGQADGSDANRETSSGKHNE